MFIFNCVNLFAEETNCGKLLIAVIKFNSIKNSAEVQDAYFHNKEFCDSSTNEPNANFEISLLDQHKKLLIKKQIFINKLVVLEKLNTANSDKIDTNKVTHQLEYRNLKFSIKEEIKNVAFYQIVSLTNNSIIGNGLLKIETIDVKQEVKK